MQPFVVVMIDDLIDLLGCRGEVLAIQFAQFLVQRSVIPLDFPRYPSAYVA